MPEKILRLGYSECTLLFIYWQNIYNNFDSKNLIYAKNLLINHLYTISGYYDNTINYTYMNAKHTDKDTIVYNKYMEILIDFIKEPYIYDYCFHKCETDDKLNEFKKFVNPKREEYIDDKIVYNFIKNKKILIISSFSPLIKEQIENGNCKKINNNFPDIDTLSTYTFPYTFFNKGPHNNFLETADYIYSDIIKTINNDYDSVLISCGAYSFLMAKKFYDNGKNVCTVGGQLQGFFGILNNRNKNFNKGKEIPNKEYWILDIPEEYKPDGYKTLEDGCYW